MITAAIGHTAVARRCRRDLRQTLDEQREPWGAPVSRVTRVAAPILPAHIHDHRVRALLLDLERRRQRVLAIDMTWSVLPCCLNPTANCNGAPPHPARLMARRGGDEG